MKRSRLHMAFLALAALLLSGCAHSLSDREPNLTATTSPFTIFNGEYVNTDAIKARPPRSIAVLPFLGDESDWTLKMEDEDPPDIVRTGLYNQIASLPYRDQELHVTDARLERAGMYTAEEVNDTLENDHDRLAGALGVDAAITGRVTHFDRVFVGLGSQVAVGCDVRMIDLGTGELLWRARHVSRGFAGGVSVSPLGMALNAIASLWNLRRAELYRETDNLFREMVATIHVPPALEEDRVRPPAIALFAATDPERTYRIGDKLNFRLVGEPGARAYVEIQGINDTIELAPVSGTAAKALNHEIMARAVAERRESGLPFPPEAAAELASELERMQVYEGAMMTPEGFESRGASATATLVSEQGGLSRRAHPGGLDFDAKPPSAPSGLEAAPLDAKVRLAWSPPADQDLSLYEVWMGPEATQGFEKLREVHSPRAIVEGLANFRPAYFKVRAVDKAGNTGGFSAELEVTPSPEPGVTESRAPGPVLSGTVDGRVFLPAEAGPYRVEGDLKVIPGGRLVIGPGAEIGFASGASLTIAGGEIAAYGETGRPVRFSPLEPGAKPGSYQGLSLEDSATALLRHVIVSGARVGIAIRDCSPDMAGIVVRDSAQAGLHLLGGAAPTVTNSAIVGNQGMGGLVIEGAGSAPRISSTVFRENSAFDVQSYAGVTIDLSGNYWARSDSGRTLGDLRLEPALTLPPEAAP